MRPPVPRMHLKMVGDQQLGSCAPKKGFRLGALSRTEKKSDYKSGGYIRIYPPLLLSSIRLDMTDVPPEGWGMMSSRSMPSAPPSSIPWGPHCPPYSKS